MYVVQLNLLYLDAEHEDGYHHDQSVFGDGISIEDTMNVLVRYENNAVLTDHLQHMLPGKEFASASMGLVAG